MVILEARPLLNVILGLVQLERSLATETNAEIDHHAPLMVELKGMSELLVKECQNLQLQVAADAARGLTDARTLHGVKKTVAFIRDAMAIGLNRRKFFEPEPRYAEYFENPKLFGDQVFTAFASANDDITEAGTCLALERSTACVMHLMRAMEVALAALAKAVNVGPQNDWGSYLRLIDSELLNRAKTAGARSADEQFYAEAAIQFDHVKRAWRNPTMHVEKTYTQDRAAEILQSVRSLMSHLATKISE
jgi:hypothetical protein